ncbi:MAG: Curli production assembly/transport component CsgG [Firmicutes bacterium]|nr:Curli production assembly/transport component CsgG [Bacillota bacterium]
MKSLLLKKAKYLLLCAIILCWFTSAITAECAPKRIGVTQFESNNFQINLPDGQCYDIGLGASDMLTTELSKNKNFEVVEREQIKSVLKEQAFGLSGAVDMATSAKLGQLLGLKYIVYGKILSAGAEDKSTELLGVRINKLSVKVQVSVRMIDTTTGAIVWADQVEGKVDKKGVKIDGVGSTRTQVSASIYDEAIRSAISQIVERIGRASPTEGAIAKVIGKKVFIDIGIEQGVQPGQTFVVYREGEVITNASGEIIGVDKNDICTLKIVRVEGNMSIAEIVDQKPLFIQQGDRVHSI